MSLIALRPTQRVVDIVGDRIQIPSNVTRLIIAEDNDPEGRRARSKAWRAYRERRLALARMPPPEQYGDWADVLRPRS